MRIVVEKDGANNLGVGTVLYQANPDRSKVAIVCGGGSGHEPSHAGFVGAYNLSIYPPDAWYS